MREIRVENVFEGDVKLIHGIGVSVTIGRGRRDLVVKQQIGSVVTGDFITSSI